jgi:hypothetical protein
VRVITFGRVRHHSLKEDGLSLKTELDVLRAEFIAQLPSEVRDSMVRAEMELAVSGITQHAFESG